MADRTVAEALGHAVHLRRVELGLKRPELARRSGLSYPYVSEIENGMKSPSATALEKLARALELSMAELLARAEAPPSVESQRGLSSADSPSSGVLAPPSPGIPPPVSHGGSGPGRTPSAAPGVGDETEWLRRLITFAVRTELVRWSETELPGLVRDEVERLRAERMVDDV
jgi:DNA-binding XRE family transcriptional regulator